MKKSLILFTALFAGTMFISNDICAGNKTLNVNDANAAWGDAEKKAMAEKCIQEISKCYKGNGYGICKRHFP